MKHRPLSICLVFALLLAGCGLAKQSADTSASTRTVISENVSTPQPAATPLPVQTPVSINTTPTKIVVTPTPFVDADVVYAREHYQGKVFESAEKWQEKFDLWDNRRPEHPGILRGIKGLSVALKYGRSLEQDSQLLNDKWKHCTIGAAIAVETDLATAEFIAWLKEYQDLLDGFVETSFDEVDFEATIDGARQAAEVMCEKCFEACEVRWGSRNAPWNGIVPEAKSKIIVSPGSKTTLRIATLLAAVP